MVHLVLRPFNWSFGGNYCGRSCCCGYSNRSYCKIHEEKESIRQLLEDVMKISLNHLIINHLNLILSIGCQLYNCFIPCSSLLLTGCYVFGPHIIALYYFSEWTILVTLTVLLLAFTIITLYIIPNDKRKDHHKNMDS